MKNESKEKYDGFYDNYDVIGGMEITHTCFNERTRLVQKFTI